MAFARRMAAAAEATRVARLMAAVVRELCARLVDFLVGALNEREQLWKQLLHVLIPSAGAIELEWTPSVGPAFAKDEALPPSAEVRASMTGVEWLRGRSGLLPGPRQLARIKQFLDPRWVDTTTELSNCSCKPHDR